MAPTLTSIAPVALNTVFLKNLTGSSLYAHAMGATLIHRYTGEEIIVDLVTDSDSYFDVVAAIRKDYPAIWGIFETWKIDD